MQQELIVLPSLPHNMIGLFRQILPQPQEDAFRGRHDRPRGMVVGFYQDPQRVRLGAKDLVHGSIEGSFEGAIRLGRHEVSVSAKHTIEIGNLEIFPEHVNCVRTVQAKGGLLQQLIPELFEPDGSRKLARLPQDPHHLSVGPQAFRALSGRDLPHGCPDDLLKALPVRLAGDHELRQRLLGIPEDQLAASQQGREIGAQMIQMPGEEFLMLGSYDDEHAFAAPQAFPEVASDVLGESHFVSLIKLHEVAARMGSFEESLPGGHRYPSGEDYTVGRQTVVGTRALLQAEVWLEMDYYVYRCVHTAKRAAMELVKVGIREFRERLAAYLLDSDTPVAITRHGDTVGYFIPARRKRSATEKDALKKAAAQLDAMLAAKGITEDELAAEFKSRRARKHR